MSCLFNSMHYFLPDLSSGDIRNKICDYIQNGGALVDGLETSDIVKMEGGNYIQNMRNTSTWGGAIEIQSACNIWQWRIIVKNFRDRNGTSIEFIPVSSNYTKTIQLEWTGGHYEPVRN